MRLSAHRLGQPQQIGRVARGFVQCAGAFFAGEHRQRHQLAMVLARPLLGMRQKRLAHAAAFVREHLVSYKVPVRFAIVDKLPRTQSLKVSVVDVQAMFAA